MLESDTEEIVMSDIKQQAKKPQYFDPEKWLVRWNNVYNNKTKSFRERKVLLHRLLKEIDESTDKVCKGEDFIIDSKKRNLLEHHLRTAVNQTIKYDYQFLQEKIPKLQENGRMTTHFVKRDMIDVGLFIDFEFKKNPLIMIAADPEAPGGTNYGLFGMEPNVWRRSALRECLDPMRRKKYMGMEEQDKFEYYMKEDQVIYCPSVPVFRMDIKSGFSFTNPCNLSFIMVPPLYRPTLENEKFTEEDREIVRKKIEMVFMTAILYGHHHIIVSAFGCGKAHNPPTDVAEIFVETIKKYRHYPLNVNFALIDDKIHENNFRGNVYPFSKVYKTLRKKKPNKLLNIFKKKAGNPN